MPRVFIWIAVAAALAMPAGAQSLPAVGEAGTLDVATWNFEWFGSTSEGPSDEALQLANVRTIIEQSGIDLWAVQEIDDGEHFEALLDSLGPAYEGQLGRLSSNAMVGFIFRTDVVEPTHISDVWLNDFRDAFAGRPPLLMAADVHLPDVTVALNFVSLHMKCCDDGYAQRVEASTRLKTRIDLLLPDAPIILLGDFNDELARSLMDARPSPYENFLRDPDEYSFTSLSIEEDGEATWCSNLACSFGSNLDHVLITDELFGAYVLGSTDRYDEVLSGVDRYVSTTSDHLPVFARFEFRTDTAVEEPSDAPLATVEVYPNPFARTATLAMTMREAGPVVVTMYDALGRLVKRVEAFSVPGAVEMELSAEGLAQGLYFVHVAMRDGIIVRPVIVGAG